MPTLMCRHLSIKLRMCFCVTASHSAVGYQIREQKCEKQRKQDTFGSWKAGLLESPRLVYRWMRKPCGPMTFDLVREDSPVTQSLDEALDLLQRFWESVRQGEMPALDAMCADWSRVHPVSAVECPSLTVTDLRACLANLHKSSPGLDRCIENNGICPFLCRAFRQTHPQS